MTEHETPSHVSRKPRLSYGELWRIRGRRLLKALRFLIVFSAVLAVVYLIADQIVWRMVIRQREAFAQRFGGTTIYDFRPEEVAAEEDAGRFYHLAYVYFAKAYEVYDVADPLSLLGCEPEDLKLDDPVTKQDMEKMARAMLAGAEPGFELVAKADAMDGCRLLPSSIEICEMSPALSETRDLMRWICGKAYLSAMDGDTTQAFEWVWRGLRVVNGLKDEPLRIPQLTRTAIASMALGTACSILDVTPGPVVIDERLQEELAKLSDEQACMRSIAGESLYSYQGYYGYYQDMNHLKAALNELRLTAAVFDIVDVLEEDDAATRMKRLADIEETAERLPGFVYPWPPTEISFDTIFVSTCYTTQAERDLFVLAVQLKAFKNAHGAYPNALSELAGSAEPLPADPFSGEGYRYAKQGEGFVVWSIGREGNRDETPPEEMDFGTEKGGGRIVCRCKQ